MRFYVISDNVDTQVGMRLAGIEGIVVHEADEVHKALSDAMEQDDIAVILMTEHLVRLCRDLVDDLKLNRARPLIVEIPDRHGNGRAKDSITRYVREAIGIRI
ncbi:MAG: V-type ATP synthase subunit F [Acutalibacteraceae bacterium]|nr:V-type ATP synthase subunit F [Clostridiales bacterium]